MKNDAKTNSRKDILVLFLITISIILAIAALSLTIISTINRQSYNTPPSSDDDSLIKNKPSSSNQQNHISYDASIANHFIPANEDNGNIADHIRGNADAKVVVIEYSDFQCPGCALFASYLPQVYSKYKDNVLFISRNYPLSMHQNARPAAIAAESAGLQGYYWQMSEALFNNQDQWSNLSGDELTNTLSELFQKVAPKGNLESFKNHLNDKKLTQKIDFDHKLAKTAHQISSTPSFFVNGERTDIIHGTMKDAISNLEKIIDSKLAE